MGDMIWLFIGCIDSFVKCFQYAWFFFVPAIIAVIILLIKKKKMKKDGRDNTKISIIVWLLIIFIILAMLTIRIWGPLFYKHIMGFYISGKEDIIEEQLEKKYNKNFTFISEGKIEIDKYAGDSVGQDINNDYSVIYKFKDDDGVPALVHYKRNYQSDFYESKRSKYEIEKSVYDYMNNINFDKKFFVFIHSPSEMIDDSLLNEKPLENFILEEREYDRIIFISTEQSDKYKDLIVTALTEDFGTDVDFIIHEYVVTEEEYEKAIMFYEEINAKDGLSGKDYDENFEFNKDNIITDDFYYMSWVMQ